MKKRKLTSYLQILYSLFFLTLLGCSTQFGPKAVTAEKNALPKFEEETLKNGLKIIFIQNSELPRISMTALLKSGAVNDPQSLPGLNSLTSSLIDEGTQRNSSQSLAERLEYLGSSLSVAPGVDFTTVSAEGLSFSKLELLGYFYEVLAQANFPEKEIERIRSQTVASLKKLSDEPEEFASAIWDLSSFGRNAYGLPASGTLTSLGKISRKDIVQHYDRFFRPNNSILAIAGDFDLKFKEEVKSRFETWIAGESPKQNLILGQGPKSSQIILSSQKGLQQTQLRIGWAPSINRLNPDFLTLRLANMVLGGAFASRLNQSVRDDKGLTYGIYSYFDIRMFGGAFVIDTFTRNDKAGETIKTTLNTLRKFETEGISDSELSAAKNVLIGQFPKTLETIDRIAFNMLVLRYYGIGDSYLTDYVKNVRSISLDQVNSAIKKHFKSNIAQVVVYGDESAIKDQLLGLAPIKKADTLNY